MEILFFQCLLSSEGRHECGRHGLICFPAPHIIMFLVLYVRLPIIVWAYFAHISYGSVGLGNLNYCLQVIVPKWFIIQPFDDMAHHLLDHL